MVEHNRYISASAIFLLLVHILYYKGIWLQESVSVTPTGDWWKIRLFDNASSYILYIYNLTGCREAAVLHNHDTRNAYEHNNKTYLQTLYNNVSKTQWIIPFLSPPKEDHNIHPENVEKNATIRFYLASIRASYSTQIFVKRIIYYI